MCSRTRCGLSDMTNREVTVTTNVDKASERLGAERFARRPTRRLGRPAHQSTHHYDLDRRMPDHDVWRAALVDEVNLRNGVVMIGRLSAAVAAAVVLALPGATSAQQSPSQESAVPIPPGQIEAAVGRLDG